MSLENIRVILVETSHTGNMGSTARAMKTMGLHHLYLVNPIIKPDSQAIALAAGASDIIHDAIITSSLDEAIADCGLVIGTSARSRSLPWPHVNAREAALKALNETKKHRVAFIFGRERVGLTNDELQKCHYHLSIPANPDYSSLNLAMAVQILAYELRMATLSYPEITKDTALEESDYPLSADLESYYNHLEKVLTDVGFIKTAHPGMIMSKLRRLYTRARPERQELNILRGIVSAFENIRHRN